MSCKSESHAITLVFPCVELLMNSVRLIVYTRALSFGYLNDMCSCYICFFNLPKGISVAECIQTDRSMSRGVYWRTILYC